jgi:hypothetical protein
MLERSLHGRSMLQYGVRQYMQSVRHARFRGCVHERAVRAGRCRNLFRNNSNLRRRRCVQAREWSSLRRAIRLRQRLLRRRRLLRKCLYWQLPSVFRSPNRRGRRRMRFHSRGRRPRGRMRWRQDMQRLRYLFLIPASSSTSFNDAPFHPSRPIPTSTRCPSLLTTRAIPCLLVKPVRMFVS